jgi:uncharacterized protein (TIGR03083 family)
VLDHPSIQCADVLEGAALLTIDVQRDVLDGGPFEVAGTTAVLPKVAALCRAFRAAQRPIVHVVRLYAADGANAEPTRRALVSGAVPVLRSGTPGRLLAGELLPDGDTDLDDELLLSGRLQPLGPYEWVMYKPRWGAFYRTPLDDHLRSIGAGTVVVAGCNFPNCPRATVYEASERDYDVVLATDAVSGLYDRGVQELRAIGVRMLSTDEAPNGGAAVVAVAAADRCAAVVTALRTLDEPALLAPSRLPGWSRLTIACHLRYGARALRAMTEDTLAGRETSYYPLGRDRQRPGTLVPNEGETPADVVVSLEAECSALHELWRSMDEPAWTRPVVEPAANPDLGPVPLARLPLLRLTEVEVHGDDLDVGLDEWSDGFVTAALPFRLQWLNTRRTNHRAVDGAIQGSWLLAADDGLRWRVAVDGATVTTMPSPPGATADACIEGSPRDLLALLLGRPAPGLRYSGDRVLGRRFTDAFPGP